MMNPQRVAGPAPRLPMKERAGTRLAILFAATFGVLFMALLIMTVFGVFSDNRTAEAQAQIQPAQLVIDPKIETDLSKAMSFADEPADVNVQNPFVDRDNLSANAGKIGGTVSRPASTTGSVGSTTNAAANGGPRSPTTNSRTTTITSAPVITNKERHEEWMKRLRAGEYVGPESETLSIDDLVPVGYSSGGNAAQEVMLFSYSLCETFSFPAGTRFYDGWLSSFTQDEVVFSYGNGITRRSYSRPNTCSARNDQQGAM
ncbi:MAG TPA: hypothetical protein VEV84_08080 [Pyrinomonadaceae bacterium]|nr:hypothetical protein [Pyrinomonadaceae bacterium]